MLGICLKPIQLFPRMELEKNILFLNVRICDLFFEKLHHAMF